MASVENTMSPPCGADRAASRRGTVQHGRQRPWPLASRPEQSPLHRPFHCPLQIARPAVLDRSALAQLLEPPYTDPYVRWCGSGGAARLPPLYRYLPLSRYLAAPRVRSVGQADSCIAARTLYSITASARASNKGGSCRPSCRAVFS